MTGSWEVVEKLFLDILLFSSRLGRASSALEFEFFQWRFSTNIRQVDLD